jgi:hypothetical protein
MVQLRYWTTRLALTGALVLSSAVAAGWKWNKLP